MRTSFDFGVFVFEHLVEHAKSFAVKLPFGFPSLISGILLAQMKDLFRIDDVVEKAPSELTFSHKLFTWKHACDLVRPSVATSVPTGGTIKVAPLSENAKSDILKGLLEEVAALKEVIAMSSRRKTACERLISVMTLPPTMDGASSSQPGPATGSHISEATEDSDSEDDVYEDDQDTIG